MSDTATGIFTGDLETGPGATENFRVGTLVLSNGNGVLGTDTGTVIGAGNSSRSTSSNASSNTASAESDQCGHSAVGDRL